MRLSNLTINQLQILDFTLWILLIYEILTIIYIYHYQRHLLLLPIIGLVFTLGAIYNTNKIGLLKEKKQKRDKDNEQHTP